MLSLSASHAKMKVNKEQESQLFYRKMMEGFEDNNYFGLICEYFLMEQQFIFVLFNQHLKTL